MTETQTTTNHRAALAPGEIRRYTVGARRYQVMHVAAGAFTQATVGGGGVTTSVLVTSTNEHEAIAAYADAIEQAEAAERDAEILTFNLPMGANMALVTGEPDESDEVAAVELLAIVRDDLRRYVPGGGEQFLDRYLAQTAVELAKLIDAYGEAMAKAAMYVTRSNGIPTATLWAGNADRLKASILAQFGGKR